MNVDGPGHFVMLWQFTTGHKEMLLNLWSSLGFVPMHFRVWNNHIVKIAFWFFFSRLWNVVHLQWIIITHGLSHSGVVMNSMDRAFIIRYCNEYRIEYGIHCHIVCVCVILYSPTTIIHSIMTRDNRSILNQLQQVFAGVFHITTDAPSLIIFEPLPADRVAG